MSKIVLCIDDSATMQQVADITFRGTEFTYVGSRSYDDGLGKAKSQMPAVILADAQMPGGKSGYDLCLAIKSDSATANIPVVILVGNHAPYDNGKGITVGADANLPKPWDTQTMLEKVTEVVTKAAASGVAKAGHGNPATQTQQVPTTRAVPVAHTEAKPATNASAASMPPRSATIMGMPTIKMPGGVAQPATPVPSKTTVMAVPPISNSGNMVGPATRSPAPPAPASPANPVTPRETTPSASSAAAAPALASITTNRAPMISGTPTKRSALVERTLAKMAAQLAEASGLQPGSPELLALLKLSTEIVERVVWEVVPELAEQIIRENLHDLTARKTPS